MTTHSRGKYSPLAHYFRNQPIEVERLTLTLAEVESVPWDTDSFGPMSWSGTRFYTPDAEQARAEVEAMVAELRAGFGRLAARARVRVAEDAAP